jgi:hypothetical protein
MKRLYDDELVEAAVLLGASSRLPGVPTLQIRRFHAERERCYQVLETEARQAAFARLHRAWFSQWGLEKPLTSAVDRFPVLERRLVALAFRRGRSRADEGAELYRDATGECRGVVALRPERFSHETTLTRLLHHELAHLADLVDASFGYSPELPSARQTAAHQRLVRDRYRLLWNISVDGRLVQRGLHTVANETQRRREFNSGFAFLPEPRRSELFDDLWQGRLANHQALCALAVDPRGLHDHHLPVPGALCPLCGFAAFQWTDARTLPPAACARIHAEFPAWQDTEAVCARCAEVYAAITGMTYPPTVCV